MIERKIKIPTNRYYVEPIRFVYGTNTVPIKLIIEDLTIVSGSSVKFYSLTENGNRFEQAGTISANEVMFTPPSGFFEVGKNKLQCEITKGSSLTYSFAIDVVCKENIMYEGTHADAIQVKSYSERAVEVAESIPADYTSLSNHVDSIDVNVENFGIVIFEWENGGITLSEGVDYSDNTKLRTKEYIPVNANETIKMIVRNTAYSNVLMYDADKTFVKQVVVNNSSDVVIPIDIAFIRIQLRDSDASLVIDKSYSENLSVIVSGVFLDVVKNIENTYIKYKRIKSTDYSDINDLPKHDIVYIYSDWMETHGLPNGYYVVSTIGDITTNLFTIQTAIRTSDYRTFTRIYGGGAWKIWHEYSRGFLTSTNDDTNRITDIESMLTNFGYVELGDGVFYVSRSINMPDGSMICGKGAATKIVNLSTTGSAIRMNSRCTVKDLSVIGAEEERTDVSKTNLGHHGISFIGDFTSENKHSGPFNSIISNVFISDFSGSGIMTLQTGRSTYAGLDVVNVKIERCNVGVNCSTDAEFSRFTNVNICTNGIGVFEKGGNNLFTACNISENILGIQILAGTNNSHGGFCNCSIDHSGMSEGYNNGYAIDLNSATLGEVFSNCQIFYGKIKIDKCVGIRFDNCNLGRNTAIQVTDSKVVTFSNSTFYGDYEGQPQSPITESGNTVFKFIECYDRVGNPITI